MQTFIFGSQFMAQMENEGYRAVKKWYRKVRDMCAAIF